MKYPNWPADRGGQAAPAVPTSAAPALSSGRGPAA
jgi:hypothetical protein